MLTGHPKKWIPWRSLCVKKTGIGTSPNDRNHYLKMEIIQGLLWFKLYLCRSTPTVVPTTSTHYSSKRCYGKSTRRCTLCAPKWPNGDKPCVIKDENRDIYNMCSRMSKMYLYDPTCLNFAREQKARKYNGGEYFPFIQYDLNLPWEWGRCEWQGL